MAAPNVRVIRRVPGRLIQNPTDLTAASPYGGTQLGIARDIEFRFGIKTSLVTSESFGGTVVESVYAGEAPILACVLRGFDNDALSAIFPNTSAGASSGDRRVRHEPDVSGQNRPGYLLNSNKSLVLLFEPISPQRHPMILLYRAVPALEDTAALNLGLDQEVGLGVVFHGSVSTNGRVYNIGLREDLSL